MAAWKPEVRFRKSAKNHVPDSIAFDYKQQTFASTTFIFSWTLGAILLFAYSFYAASPAYSARCGLQRPEDVECMLY